MAIDLKQGIDLKEIGPLIKALFAKDSSILGNKLVLFSIGSVLVTLFLLYSIYSMSDNQSIYDEANNNYKNNSVKLNQLEKKFKKTVDSNERYFEHLMASPKDKSELSAEVTNLVSQYKLLLKSIDLKAKVDKQKGKGIKLVVSGSYLNLIRFSTEMNEVLSASKLVNLSVTKPRKGNSLIMELAIVFSAPPSANTLPLPSKSTVENTVKLINKESVLDGFLNLFISSAKASEGELLEILPVDEPTNLPPLQDELKIKGLSLFQIAYRDARTNGFTKFEFTNKAGETNLYLTGLKVVDNILDVNQEVVTSNLPDILPVDEPTNLPPLTSHSTKIAKKIITPEPQKAKPLNKFQKAYVDALVQGQKFFEYKDAKSEASIIYKTDEKAFKLAGFVENPTDNNQQSENNGSANAESLRDPFASPGQAGAPKINRGSSNEASENPYYLSGVIASEHLELCVIITPLGESKIYHIGEKLTDKIIITAINDNAILINNSTEKIMIGDEVR